MSKVTVGEVEGRDDGMGSGVVEWTVGKFGCSATVRQVPMPAVELEGRRAGTRGGGGAGGVTVEDGEAREMPTLVVVTVEEVEVEKKLAMLGHLNS
jgi:hypothetical protein